MPTLYRKYRPSTFADVYGQEHLITTIKNEIALGKIAQAYLFSGPRGVGKTTTARLLAKAVNCLTRKEGQFEPCNACGACEQINAGRHIDVIEVDAASQTGVDNVRENIIENAQFKPTTAKYKVFIIDEVHMLSNSSFNALLKTLEEPPAHVIFILATTELHKLPATVISRCQRFNFKKIGYDEMLARLKKISEEEKIKVDKEVFGRIINKSDGCLRDAESLLGQVFSLDLKKITVEDAQMILPSSNVESIIEFLEAITQGDGARALKLINTLTEEGINLDQFAYDTIEVLHACLITKATLTPAGQDYSEESLKKIKKIAGTLSVPRLITLIDRALARRLEIKTAPLPQLPLELLAMEFSDAAADANPPTSNVSPISYLPSPADPSPFTLHPTNSPAPAEVEPAKPTHRFTETIKNAIAHITHDQPIKTTLAEIKGKWNEVVTKISATAPSLTFMLKMCVVKDLVGNELFVTIPFSLHKEKLDERKNKNVIEGFLETFFSEKIRLVCELVPEATPPEPEDLSSLAVQFGGEVMN
ncbi:MAG: DNA polymerase III, subunit gamma and tau [Candidatus Magasanikbacteria bacterium RIFCSPHIGHO2_01_FULL_47_8]|uniref:DNA polymerase III subunit gamma/tau n=1 Tax=Candidatus Magasanikbacteria bacterium RIFCSPHIGHO2_01_FULL_47_8 TaxID=1798673 RepID=A0A1F6MBX9_9BACT|nr:MAG: DNA polymerase III, subunit gamma and tau [Candidatus Magasanikbacteria bacterium RIFCSPHIGHO2_01_FULL_47_8]